MEKSIKKYLIFSQRFSQVCDKIKIVWIDQRLEQHENKCPDLNDVILRQQITQFLNSFFLLILPKIMFIKFSALDVVKVNFSYETETDRYT